MIRPDTTSSVYCLLAVCVLVDVQIDVGEDYLAPDCRKELYVNLIIPTEYYMKYENNNMSVDKHLLHPILWYPGYIVNYI